jgi:large subunit ribosomal protein L23
MSIENLIIKPIVTEKSMVAEDKGKYTFRILPKANKIEVRKAIEKIFGIKVKDVNILNTKSKTRKRGRVKGKVSGYKKAVVTLQKGQTIKLRAEKKEEKKKAPKKTDKPAEEVKTEE